MKKTLYSTTALAAAGLLTLGASDAFAQAAAPAAPEKLKMTIGGFFTAYAGYASNSIDTSNGAGGTTRANYGSFDVKNDSEIAFKGSVALDNGMKVSLQVEFETDTATAGGGSTSTSTYGLDESWLGLDTNGLGEVRIGTQKYAHLTLGVGAPNAGGLNPANGDTSLWIVRPSSGISIAAPFGFPSGADQMRIKYMSPTIAGFRFGTSYQPSQTDSDAMPVIGGPGSESQSWDAIVQYGVNVGGVGVRLSAGYLNVNGSASASSESTHFGTDFKLGDWTLGGYWGHIWQSDTCSTGGNTCAGGGANTANADSWNAGLMYAPGPWKVALRTTQTYADATRTIAGKDKAIMYKVAGNYTLGPGVDLTADVIRMEWRDEANVAASENKGYAVIGGIAVTF